MTVLAICLIAVGGCASTFGLLRIVTARRRVLAPGEIPPSSGIPVMVAGDLMLAAGILLLLTQN